MNKRLAGAVDIGGTKILVGIVDDKGNVHEQDVFPTITGEGGAEKSSVIIVENLRYQARKMSIPFDDLEGIGIVCAGPVDSAKGIVKNPYTLSGWEGCSLVGLMTELSGLKSSIENDVNGALLGEVYLRGLENNRVMMVSFGTGIGVAVCYYGKLHLLGEHFHPEMGHTIVDNDGPDCYCGHKGCFESLWSGAALNHRAAEIGFTRFDNLFEAWKNGNPVASEFMGVAKRQFKNGIWNLMTVFKPDTLILGGGLMKSYFNFAEELIGEDLLGAYDFVENYRVLEACKVADSALVGASRLIFAKV